ncbi:hypothetical protein Tco_0263622, partial [Tanacetum coccineum]
IIMAQQQHTADVHPDELCPPNKRYDLMDANKKVDLEHVQCLPESKILMNIGMKRISDKRTKNEAKNDKTEHKMEKREMTKSNQSQSPRKTKSTVKTGADTEEYLMGPPKPI